MAVMIPNEPPLLRDSNESENDFWYQLRDQLDDDFYVYHGLPYLTADADQGEIDFLVVHRRLGFLNIECKGWGVHRDENGIWYRRHPGAIGKRDRLSRNPVEQARDQIEDIIEELRTPARRALDERFRKFPLAYGWALAFPMTDMDDEEYPPELEEQILMDSTDLHDLQSSVEAAMGFYRQKDRGGNRQLSSDQFEKFRSLISPTVEMPPVLSAQIERENRKIDRISDEQVKLLNHAMGNRRLRVTGGAGTGKTVLALKATRMLASKGKDVLLTCFNSKLAEFLRDSVDAWPAVSGTIDVDNFHGLGVQAGEDLGDGLDFPSPEASSQQRKDFWQQEVPFALMEALDAGKSSMGPWDAIIVDEAQDFAEDWWPILECGLREDGQIAIFYDKSQRLFDHSAELPEWGFEFALHENFRNTQAIAEPVQQLGDTDIRPHKDCPEGEEPSVYQQQGPSKTQKKIGELIEKFVERQRLDYSNIAILSPHRSENSALEGRERLGGHPVVHDVDEWYAGDGVLHSTISAFKGLEAEVVLLIDIDPDDKRCSKNARYVAASRAINRLHVFETGNWLAE